MSDHWLIDLPYTTPPLSANGREHHMARARKVRQIRGDVRYLTNHHKVPALDHITVTLHYRPRTRRRRDPGNLYPVSKAAIDGLVDAGVVPDDNPRYLTEMAPVIDEPSRHPRLYLVIEDTSRDRRA